MGIITNSRLTALTETKLGFRSFSESLNEAKRETKAYVDTTIFLSHSHDDLKDGSVDKAIVFLRRLGIRVYIDSHDTSMPPFTNAETARKIKQAIADNKKFILLATNNSINSKWCNWELGFGDAKKYINGIALFPLADSSATWQGTEYLKIYPRIEESNYYNEVYKVIYPDGTEKGIIEWLKL